MNKVFAIPYHYIKTIGFNESAVLLYLINGISNLKCNIAHLSVKKSDIDGNSEINFITYTDFSKAIDSLYDMGFIFRKIGKRKSSDVYPCVMNIILFELFGEKRYKSLLCKYDGELSGFYIDPSSISMEELSFPDYPSMTSKGYYVNYADGIESVYRDIMSVYSLDIDKVEERISNGKISAWDGVSSGLKNIYSLFFLKGFNTYYISLYNLISRGGEIDFKREGDIVKIDNSNSCSTSSNSSSEAVDLKDLARDNLSSYYQYMRIKDVLKKPISGWTSKDFVIYMYCGMAKSREGIGDFVFPNYGKDCSKISVAVERYGKKRIQKIIHTMVSDSDGMIDFCGFSDFRPSMSVLMTDWMMDKIIYYIDEKAKNNAVNSLSESLNMVEHKKEDNDLRKPTTGAKLEELRDMFNKDKETK